MFIEWFIDTLIRWACLFPVHWQTTVVFSSFVFVIALPLHARVWSIYAVLMVVAAADMILAVRDLVLVLYRHVLVHLLSKDPEETDGV